VIDARPHNFLRCSVIADLIRRDPAIHPALSAQQSNNHHASRRVLAIGAKHRHSSASAGSGNKLNLSGLAGACARMRGGYTMGMIVMKMTRRLMGAAALAAFTASLAAAPAQAGESVLYSFQGGTTDGTKSYASLVSDQQGAFYGATSGGGSAHDGTVFKLTPPVAGQTQWTETVLYSFQGGTTDGDYPAAGVIFDQQGALYGTTFFGGSADKGTVFKLTPPGPGQTEWTESVLYNFCTLSECTDGADPTAGLIFDQQGALYSTTYSGGSADKGTAFKLTPPSGGETQWTESVLYNFCTLSDCSDGANLSAGLIFDAQGALYSVASHGGGSSNCSGGCGTAFKLTPPTGQQTQWTESVLYSFQGGTTDGSTPYGGLIFDRHGALYGTTWSGGGSGCSGGCGTLFKLTPPVGEQPPWSESVLYSFKGGPTDGGNPEADMIFDQQGALYGTTYGGGSSNCSSGCGALFKLTPPGTGEMQWSESVLHSFCSQTDCTDGLGPSASLIVGADGALYSTTYEGGTKNFGTVFRQCSVEGGMVFGGRADLRCLHW
jgi:uncharacterized repeat protein (TIGR03803 family)